MQIAFSKIYIYLDAEHWKNLADRCAKNKKKYENCMNGTHFRKISLEAFFKTLVFVNWKC